MARNRTSGRQSFAVLGTQGRELTVAELDAVSGGMLGMLAACIKTANDEYGVIRRNRH